VEDFTRLRRLASAGPVLKASVPGPYTLSGRLIPNEHYPDRWALTDALLPIVRAELASLLQAGCTEITVDEPSMSCYAHREDPARFVDLFNRTVESVAGRCRLSTHLCFGNYKGRAVGPRRYAPMFPAFLDLHVDEIHLEMASREFAELDLLQPIAARKDVAVGIIDVKSYYVETVEDVAARGAGVSCPCARRPAVVRAGLRPQPDRALGGATKAREPGRRSAAGPPKARFEANLMER